MKKKTVAHNIDKADAKRRVSAEIAAQAEEYGIDGRWNGHRWTGKRTGVEIVVQVNDRDVVISADLAFYVPYSEDKVAKKMAKVAQRVLR